MSENDITIHAFNDKVMVVRERDAGKWHSVCFDSKMSDHLTFATVREAGRYAVEEGLEIVEGMTQGKHFESLVDWYRETLVEAEDWSKQSQIVRRNARAKLGEIVETRGTRCVYCLFDFGANWELLTVDHFKPLSAGGSNDMSNLYPACRACNFYKLSYIPRQATPSWKTLLKAATHYGAERPNKALVHHYNTVLLADHLHQQEKAEKRKTEASEKHKKSNDAIFKIASSLYISDVPSAFDFPIVRNA